MTRIIYNNGTLSAYNISSHEIQPEDIFGYKIVAKIWDDKSWCAFRGQTDWSDDKVWANGDEISFEVARLLFPTIAHTVAYYGS